MIKITEFDTICNEIRQAVPGISQHLLVAHEDHAIARLGDKAGVILMAIIPSADPEGSDNGRYDTNVTWFFVLEKVPSDQTAADEIKQYQRTQDILLKIRNWIENAFGDGDRRFSRYKPGSGKIEPEYKEFGGFNGWSMSLIF